MHGLLIATTSSKGTFSGIFQTYGYYGVFFMIFLESVGIPVPGEITLVAAGIYASTNPSTSPYLIVIASILGGGLGSVVGYIIGSSGGFRLVRKYGKRIGLNDERLKVGHYVFNKRGLVVVIAGRFVSVLRAFLGIFAGINKMNFKKFIVANFVGAVLWSLFYGIGSYKLGATINKVSSVMTYILVPVAVIAIVGAIIFIKKNESKLIKRAEEAYPGSIDEIMSNHLNKNMQGYTDHF